MCIRDSHIGVPGGKLFVIKSVMELVHTIHRARCFVVSISAYLPNVRIKAAAATVQCFPCVPIKSAAPPCRDNPGCIAQHLLNVLSYISSLPVMCMPRLSLKQVNAEVGQTPIDLNYTQYVECMTLLYVVAGLAPCELAGFADLEANHIHAADHSSCARHGGLLCDARGTAEPP